jgi:ATP-dependent Clp protease adapter protein ClpS
MPETIEAPPEVVPHQPADPSFKEMLGNLLGKKEGQQDKQEPDEPAMWAVLLHNDNTTFPNFVILVLNEAFKVEGNAAQRLMMKAHTTGQAVVIVTTKDRADTMMRLAHDLIGKAEAGLHFYRHVPSCELTFSLREETPDKGRTGA